MSSAFRTPAAAFDGDAAMRASAQRLLVTTEAAAPPPRLTRTRSVELYSRGVQYDTYVVDGSGGRPETPRLTRLQLFTRPGSVIDLALSHDGSSITSMDALRPVTLAGGAFPHLPRLFDQLRKKPIEAYCAGLAGLFRALPAASRFARAGDRPPPAPSSPASRPLTPLVRLWQPELPLGSHLPAVKPGMPPGSLEGDPSLARRSVAVLFGDLDDSVCRGMIRGMALATHGLPDVTVVAVLADSPDAVAKWAAEQRELAGKLPRLVPDPEKTLRPAFKPPILPYFYLFNRKHELVYKSFWSGPAALRNELAEHLKEGSD